jgi:hypothetical protein
MYWADYRMAKAVVDLCIREAHVQAECRHWLRQAMPVRQGGLSQQACWLAHQSGCLLVRLGERLQRYGLPQPLPLEGEVTGGS